MAAVGIWQAIKDFFANSIEWLYQLTDSIGMPSYILAIFLFTLIIKLLLQPMMNKQMRSTRKMQLLTPEVDEIKRRYANDPQRMNMEMMKLYKEHGASPMAGCLPMLIQFPILIALFDSIRNFGASNSVHPLYPDAFHFLCWDNLAAIVKDAPYPWLLPIIAAAATFLQQWLTTPNTKDRQQQIMLIAFPLMFFFFVRSFPVLMAFYWIFYALIGVAIMYPLLRRWKRIDTAALEAARKAKQEEEERRKAARKAARENYYNGKPRKEQDKHGNRGHHEEEEEPEELTPEQEEERKFKTWLKDNDYIVEKKRVKLHPYSVEPEVVLLVMDGNGVEQDVDALRREYQLAQRVPAAPSDMKEMLGFGRKKKKAAKAEAAEQAADETASDGGEPEKPAEAAEEASEQAGEKEE